MTHLRYNLFPAWPCKITIPGFSPFVAKGQFAPGADKTRVTAALTALPATMKMTRG